jgi:hypothetical protein
MIMDKEVPYNVCFESGGLTTSFMEFQLNETQSEIFSVDQLIRVSFSASSSNGNTLASQQLRFIFAAAEVTVLGQRLDYMVKRILERQLYVLRVLPKRYAGIVHTQVAITSIVIEDKL